MTRLTWSEVEDLTEELAKRVAGFHPTQILGVSRGGLIPATMLAHQLGVKRVGSAQVLDGAITAASLSLGRDGRVLVVEDVTDSGTSLNLMAAWAAYWYPVRTCALLARRGCIMPDFLPDRDSSVVDQIPGMPWEVDQ